MQKKLIKTYSSSLLYKFLEKKQFSNLIIKRTSEKVIKNHLKNENKKFTQQFDTKKIIYDVFDFVTT